MDNTMDSMLEVYLFEANSLIEQLDDILLNSEKKGSFSTESINEIFRIMHTIKGSSAMMQFSSLMTISHKIEDLFAYVRENGISEDFSQPLFDLMFKSSDFLKDEIAHVENNEELTINIGSFEQEINGFLEKISSEGRPDTEYPSEIINKTIENVNASKGYNLSEKKFAIKVFFEEGSQMENIRAFMLVNSISEVCSDFTYYPADVKDNSSTIDEIVQNGFEIYLNSKKDLDMVQPVIENFVYVNNFLVNENAENMKETNKAETENKNLKKANGDGTHSVKQNLINVNLLKLDDLMDIMGEIIITESMVNAIPGETYTNMDQFSKSTRKLSKLTDELQEIIMSMRMVPVSSAFHKMNRVVRDMNKKLEKDVQLVLVGEETEVDKTIVDSISDPLMHLVRNSMDHGIEDTALRVAAEKPAKGTITLSAMNTGGEIIISVEDDGGGLDPVPLMEKAKGKGLLTKPESEYTLNEIYSFILMPGFSTNESVTEFSGRGVGMDVVKKNIGKVGGDVLIDSEKGKGTLTLFKIPLTLAIVDGMEISVGNSLFTIQINNIIQSFKPEREDIILDTDNNEIIKVRDKYYPILRLHKVYDIDTQVKDIEEGILILVDAGENPYCIFADSLLGEQRVVVKSIPPYLKNFGIKKQGISGCTILGDGNISIILDVIRLRNNMN